MSKVNKKNLILLITGIFCFLALAIVFFFFDLDISKSIASDKPNWFFLLLAAIGEFPIYFGPILFGLVYGFTNNTKKWKCVAHLVGLAGIYVSTIRLAKGIMEVFYDSSLDVLRLALLAIVALLLYVLLFVMLSKISKDNLSKIRDIALIYLIVTVSSFALVQVSKYLWGRTRFRALSDDYHEFSNFLTINGFSKSSLGDDYKSFPSGHTNSATTLIILGLITPRFSSKKWLKYLVYALTILYALIVAISRICVKAHYASDVLFGFGISISCFLITYAIFKKKGWLYDRSNKC